jgi:antitoxin component of MazEF toxin-antitoxin module
MEKIFSLGKKKLLKVGGSRCLSVPDVWLKTLKTDANTEFSIDLLDDQSIRIKPN